MANEDQEKSFAQLLEESELKAGQELQVGQTVRGPIIKVGQDSVYIDTGTKTDGVAEKKDLLDEAGEFPYREGDSLELFVIAKEGNEIRLAPSFGAEGGLEQLQQAMDNHIPVDGKVKETCKGGFRVRVMGRTAFCPLSQMDIRPVDDPEALTGQTIRFLITRLEAGGRNIVLSRRQLLEQEQAAALQTFTEQTQPGDILQGTVTRLAPYGTFVQVASGLEGLVHISEMSWSRNLSPEEIVAPGDSVQVKLLKLEDQGKGKVRMDLSMKQTQQDPWEEAASRFEPGTVIEGTVTRTAPFGAFVELQAGIEGLVHISEMSYLKRVHKPEDEVSPGERIRVMIKNIDQENRRIALSMRDAKGDPWEGVSERYAQGQVVEGRVEKREEFGLFVRLEPGVVGLLPASVLKRTPEVSLDKKKPGDPVSVSIDSVDEDNRRISLTPADQVQSEDWKSYAAETKPMGSLGDKLKQALEDKYGSSE